MKPMLHAKNSVRKFGGTLEDYMAIHDWFDAIKAHIADARHRILLHNSFGIYLCEQVFGDVIVKEDGSTVKMPYITISTGKKVGVRDIAEQHVLDDMGCIPSLVDVLSKAGLHADIVGGKQRKVILMDETKVIIED